MTLRPEGPIFPINDLRFDLLDRLPPSREDAELDVIKLDDNEMKELNAEILCRRFPNLIRVSVCRNRLNRIECFPWFANLRELYLQGNCLTTKSILAQSWRACGRCLEVLDLRANFFEIDILKNLEVLQALRYLDMRGNPCTETEADYRDMVCSALPALKELDRIKVRTALGPLFSSANNISHAGNPGNKKLTPPHPDVINQAFDDFRQETSLESQGKIEAKLKAMEEEFQSALTRQMEEDHQKHKRALKMALDKARAEVREEVLAQQERLHNKEMVDLKFQHETERKHLVRSAVKEKDLAVENAVSVAIEETTTALMKAHENEMKKLTTTLKMESDHARESLKRQCEIETASTVEEAVREAVEKTTAALTGSHAKEMEGYVEESRLHNLEFERKVKLQYEEERVLAISNAVDKAIEKTVIAQEAMNDKVAQLTERLKTTEEQFQMQERVLGWGKANDRTGIELGCRGDNSSSFESLEISNGERSLSFEGVTARQTAAGYTRLLAAWREKVFELLIPGAENSSPTVSSDLRRKAWMGKSENDPKINVAVMEAKLDFARREVAESRATERARIRAEEQASYLSTALDEQKDRYKCLESKVVVLKEEIKRMESVRTDSIVIQERLERTSAELQQKDAILYELRSALETAQAKLNDTMETEQLKVHVKRLTDDLEDAKKQRKHLENQLQKEQLKNTATLNSLSIEKGKSSTAYSDLEQINNKLSMQLKQSTEKLVLEEVEKKKHIAHARCMEEKVARSETEMRIMKNQLDACKQKIVSMAQEFADCECKINSMKEHIAIQEREVYRLKQGITKYESEIDIMKQKVENSANEAVSMKKEISAREEAICALKEENIKSKQECAHKVVHVLEPIIEALVYKAVFERRADIVNDVVASLEKEQQSSLGDIIKSMDCIRIETNNGGLSKTLH